MFPHRIRRQNQIQRYIISNLPNSVFSVFLAASPFPLGDGIRKLVRFRFTGKKGRKSISARRRDFKFFFFRFPGIFDRKSISVLRLDLKSAFLRFTGKKGRKLSSMKNRKIGRSCLFFFNIIRESRKVTLERKATQLVLEIRTLESN